MPQSVKRSYDASRRRQQAAETRLRIIAAAHELFVTDGYGRTTIADVARAAGVSVETVYSAFGNKRTLLHQVWYVSVRGDEDEVRLVDRPEVQEVLAIPELAQRLRAHATLMARVLRRITPLEQALQGAAASEPVAAEMLAEFDEARLDAIARYARAAKATGQLAVSERECRDVLFATMDGALWHRLVEQRGWTEKRLASWLANLWISTLVSAAAPS